VTPFCAHRPAVHPTRASSERAAVNPRRFAPTALSLPFHFPSSLPLSRPHLISMVHVHVWARQQHPQHLHVAPLRGLVQLRIPAQPTRATSVSTSPHTEPLIATTEPQPPNAHHPILGVSTLLTSIETAVTQHCPASPQCPHGQMPTLHHTQQSPGRALSSHASHARRVEPSLRARFPVLPSRVSPHA
jgi:hypothetical protein